MYKFSFVILHYETINDTIECINSILNNIEYIEYEIIVVDNASKNKSGIQLKELYKGNSKIHVLINLENIGFAKGNNIGYKFAKDELRSSFIALINNDTLIKQKDFIDIVIKKYKETKFDLLGPDILSINEDYHQNPKPLSIRNKMVLKRLILHHIFLLLLNYILIDQKAEQIKKYFVKKPLIKNITNKDYDHTRDLYNVKLSGCCLIFSPKFIADYDGLYDKTFLYSEEEILFYQMKRDNRKTLYSPDIKIIHKEDATLNSLFTQTYKRRRFYYKNYIRSGFAFLKLLNQDNIMESWDE